MIAKRRKIIFVPVVLLITSALFVFFGIGFFGFPIQQKIQMKSSDSEVYVLGAKIRYRSISGKGVPVIFLHGNNLSLDYWETIMSHLPGRRLIAFDLIGFAGSDRPDLSYSLECHRRYCLAFMDALGIQKAILVGHSMAGAIVAWATAKSGDRIIADVIISAPGVPGSLVYAWPKSLLCYPGMLNRSVFYLTISSLFKEVFPLSLARQTLGVTYSYNQDYVEALKEIHQPTLLLMSPADDRVPFGFWKVYDEKIKNLEFKQIPNVAGHMAPMTYPEGTALLISNFLDHIQSE